MIRKETLAKCPLLSSDVQTTFVELPSPKFSAEAPMNEPAAIIHFCYNKQQIKGWTKKAEHSQEFLKGFLNDPEVPMDNNETESSLRSFCLHKHAWKVIDTIEGAKASAIIYSITETAKANGLNPFQYMEYLLTELMEHLDDTDRSFLDDLLSWLKTLPDICRSSQQK